MFKVWGKVCGFGGRVVEVIGIRRSREYGSEIFIWERYFFVNSFGLKGRIFYFVYRNFGVIGGRWVILCF